MKKTTRERIAAIPMALAMMATSLCAVGCKKKGPNRMEEYVKEYMDAIPVEFSGYKIVERERNESSQFDDGLEEEKTIITSRGEESVLLTSKGGSYLIEYNQKIIEVDEAFMEEKSATYIRMCEMWYKYNGSSYVHTNTHLVGIVDGLIFIATKREEARFGIYYCLGNLPWALFKLDLETGEVLYVDYLPKMRDTRGIKIIKETEEI